MHRHYIATIFPTLRDIISSIGTKGTMVDAFIGVLTPKSKVTEGAKAKEALLKSVNSKLSQCLHLSFVFICL